MSITRFDFLAAFARQYPGVNPLGIYCSLSGTQFGTLTESEASNLFILVEDMDAESAADDWFTRQMVSMRPSMQWNAMRADSLNRLRRIDPKGTLGYMLSRLWTAKVKLTGKHLNPAPTLNEVVRANHDRILLTQMVAKRSRALTQRLLYALAELDARIGLQTLHPPFAVQQLHDKSVSAFTLLLTFKKWHRDTLKSIEEHEKSRELSSQFYRDGNTLAKSMYVSMFMEWDKPNFNRPDGGKTYIKSSSAKSARVPKKVDAMMLDLLGDLNAPAVESQPTPKVVHPPIKFVAPKPKLASTGKMLTFGRKVAGA